MRVLVVDDHLIVRQGLKHSIENAQGMVPTVETCSGEETLKLVQRNAHDVVLLGLTYSIHH